MTKQHLKLLKHLLLLIIIAVFLGAIAGFLTVGFVALLDFIHELLWIELPNNLFGGATMLYIMITTTLGGLLVGLCNHYLGDYPKSLEQSLDEFKKTKKFDYKHLPQSIVASYASLGFGASLGPEAALISIIGGLSSWIADTLKRFTSIGELAFVSVSATVGTLFGSPVGGAALAHISASKKQQKKIWLYIPAIVAGAVSFVIFKHFSNGGFFSFDFLPYSFTLSDVLPVLLITLASTGFGWLFFYTAKVARYSADKTRFNPIFKAIIGGLGLGLLATITSFALFSGHEGIQELIDNLTTFTAIGLMAVAIIKLLATNWLLATGWKGGRFFPVMFAGAAFGLALATLSNVDPMIGLGVGLSATLSAVLQKPAAAILLLLFFFPFNMYILVILGALVGGVLAKKLFPQAE